ncbi:hypothetical protein GCM10009841_00140 [Microlunatus panaciterrae]|uniref:PH domain-containing protein n=1 Tax=Microlunatus panaciterrae TaxID=400768 RepID=A0ABS2RLD5_9ACTN|nr:hypothetical protein [Microlunatus panaciterrae]MBM7799297.1 hypothetical protein [Microlunatus panaciterrae]
MSPRSIEELAVPYDPGPVEQKVRRRRQRFRSRLVSLGVTVLVLLALSIFLGRRFNGAAVFGIYGLMLAVSVAWLVVSYLGYRMAKNELAAMGSGTAVVIDRSGVELAGVRVPWQQVSGLAAVKGRLFAGPLLQLSRHSGEPVSVPFDHIDVPPATLDSVARAYSGGRHGVDLSALDS